MALVPVPAPPRSQRPCQAALTVKLNNPAQLPEARQAQSVFTAAGSRFSQRRSRVRFNHRHTDPAAGREEGTPLCPCRAPRGSGVQGKRGERWGQGLGPAGSSTSSCSSRPVPHSRCSRPCHKFAATSSAAKRRYETALLRQVISSRAVSWLPVLSAGSALAPARGSRCG